MEKFKEQVKNFKKKKNPFSYYNLEFTSIEVVYCEYIVKNIRKNYVLPFYSRIFLDLKNISYLINFKERIIYRKEKKSYVPKFLYIKSASA